MPRPQRQSVGGECYHVLNRSNNLAPVFQEEAAYEAFVNLLAAACERRPMGVLAYCLLPNHYHLVLQPVEDGDLSPWMQWLSTSHVRQHHRAHGSSGHVWQGRYRSFPIQADPHLVTVLRYVERHPLRAGLVARAEDWPWSSLRWWGDAGRPGWLVDGPLPRPADWLAVVNHDQEDPPDVRQCIVRGAPFGAVRRRCVARGDGPPPRVGEHPPSPRSAAEGAARRVARHRVHGRSGADLVCRRRPCRYGLRPPPRRGGA